MLSLYWVTSLLALVRNFVHPASGEQFKLLNRYLFLVPKVPLDDVFELAWLELEACSFDQFFEVFQVNHFRFLVLDSVEQSFEEHVVLLLVGEFVVRDRVKALHEFTEFVLLEALIVTAIRLHDVYEGFVEPVLRVLVILRFYRSF